MDRNVRTDEQLVTLFKQTREADYFEEIVTRYKQRIYLLAFKFLRSNALAEEATQEVFLKVFENIDQYKEGNFSNWLIRTASNLSIDKFRSISREPLEPDPELKEEPKENIVFHGKRYNQVEFGLLCDELKIIIGELKPEQRICLLLKYTEGYDYEEIAKETGYSIKEVKTYLQNARRNVMLKWERLEKRI